MILSSLTAPTSSSVGPSVPVSPIFVLRSVVVVRLRTSATLPPGFCCVQMRSCALSFKCGCAVKEKFPIFSGGAGSAGLRAGGGGEESPVVFHRRHRQHTHREGRRRKTNGGVGRGGRFCCFQWRLGQRALGLCVSYKVQSQCCCHWPWGSRWDGSGATM